MSEQVKRYDVTSDMKILRTDGRWVEFSDHATALAAKDAEIERQCHRLPNFFREVFRVEFPGDADARKYAVDALAVLDKDIAGLEYAVTLQSDAIKAKDARIAELEAHVKLSITVKNNLADQVKVADARVAELERKAKAARRENLDLIDVIRNAYCTVTFEINPENYSHDEVCQLNQECAQSMLILRDVFSRPDGGKAEMKVCGTCDDTKVIKGGGINGADLACPRCTGCRCPDCCKPTSGEGA